MSEPWNRDPRPPTPPGPPGPIPPHRPGAVPPGQMAPGPMAPGQQRPVPPSAQPPHPPQPPHHEAPQHQAPQHQAPQHQNPQHQAPQHQELAPSMHKNGQPGRFTQPVELKCVIDVGKTMARMIPMCVMAGFLAFLVVAVVIGMTLDNPVLTYVGGIAAGLAVAAGMYFAKRSDLERRFREQQRLTLTPQGMVRVDGHIRIEMPWSGMSRVEVRNSALSSGARVRSANPGAGLANAAIAFAERLEAAGIVGQVEITPLPGASRRMLKAHDRSGGSRLRRGEPHRSPNGLIFPAEFEHEWANGEVGAWMRHFRPDIALTG